VRVRVFRWRSMCSMTGVVLSVGGGRGGSLADGDVEGVGTDRPLSALWGLHRPGGVLQVQSEPVHHLVMSPRPALVCGRRVSVYNRVYTWITFRAYRNETCPWHISVHHVTTVIMTPSTRNRLSDVVIKQVTAPSRHVVSHRPLSPSSHHSTTFSCDVIVSFYHR